MKKQEFYIRLQQMMATLKITQQDIADKTGIAKSIISRYVNNKMQPRILNLQIIAKAYGINPVWLMGYDCEMFDSDNDTTPYYLMRLESLINDLNEKEREIAYNVLIAMFERQ